MEKYLRVCRTCGKAFVTEDPNERVCPECKADSKDMQLYKQYTAYKAYKSSRRRKSRADHFECVKIVDEYNPEHGTNLSYGQYDALVRCGHIKNKKW